MRTASTCTLLELAVIISNAHVGECPPATSCTLASMSPRGRGRATARRRPLPRQGIHSPPVRPRLGASTSGRHARLPRAARAYRPLWHLRPARSPTPVACRPGFTLRSFGHDSIALFSDVPRSTLWGRPPHPQRSRRVPRRSVAPAQQRRHPPGTRASSTSMTTRLRKIQDRTSHRRVSRAASRPGPRRAHCACPPRVGMCRDSSLLGSSAWFSRLIEPTSRHTALHRYGPVDPPGGSHIRVSLV